MTALHQMAGMGNAIIVQGLLCHGAQVDAQETNGSTPLMWAARNGHLGVMNNLLDHGADPRRIDRDGLSSLDWAQRHGAPEGIARLEQWVLHQEAPSVSGESLMVSRRRL